MRKAIDIDCPVVGCERKVGQFCVEVSGHEFFTSEARVHKERVRIVINMTRDENALARKALKMAIPGLLEGIIK